MKGSFFQALIIILFASAIVLLGTHELALRYGVHRGSASIGRTLVQEMHGQGDIGQVLESKPRSERSGTRATQSGDALESSDRDELSKLIGSVAP